METNKVVTPVIVFAPNVLAGAERVVITGTIALHELGAQPHLIVIQETRAPHYAENFIKEFPKELKISVVKSVKALDFKLSAQIENALKQDSNVFIHTHGFKALVACGLIRNKKYKHVHTHHGNTSHTFKVRVYEWMANLAMKRCDHVIAVSEAMKSKLLHTLTPYKNITAIPNMLSFKNAEAIRNIRRSKQTSEVLQLIFIGRLSPEKGLMSLLSNINKSSIKEAIHLTILGDGDENLEARNFVGAMKLNSSVTFKGFVNNPSDYLKTADALVLPSFTEGLPMTLIEALASGVPVIANDVGAISSLLVHLKNGYLTKSNDFSEWEAAFIALKNQVASWQAYALDKGSTIEAVHNRKTWAERTLKLYLEIT